MAHIFSVVFSVDQIVEQSKSASKRKLCGRLPKNTDLKHDWHLAALITGYQHHLDNLHIP